MASNAITVQTVSDDLSLHAPAAKDTQLNRVSSDVGVRNVSGLLSAEPARGDVPVGLALGIAQNIFW